MENSPPHALPNAYRPRINYLIGKRGIVVEPAVQIKLVRENLALAMALWAAAQKGTITAGFVPSCADFVSPAGQVVSVSVPLVVRDNQDMVRCINNQMRSAFAFSAIQTHRALESVFSRPPLQESDPDRQAARCTFYLLNQALNYDLIAPIWVCPPDYRRCFEVRSISFTFDASGLDGKRVYWDDFGGLNKYLDLLEYCSDQAANCPPPELPRHAQSQSTYENPEETQPASPHLTLSESESPEARRSSDQVADFVETRCVVSSKELIIAKDLYDAYMDWCQEVSQEPLAQRSFGMRLTTLGFQRRRRGRGRHWWLGVGLKKS
jgi:hypothetical protein